jgi:hypothetical protein
MRVRSSWLQRRRKDAHLAVCPDDVGSSHVWAFQCTVGVLNLRLAGGRLLGIR